MKSRIFLVLVLAGCAAVSAGATVRYWDINGATPGAGGNAPSGSWDTTTPNWSSDPDGAGPTFIWSDGDDAVFSAGSDATNTFTVSVEAFPTVGNVTNEEGLVTFSGAGALNLGGGAAGKGILHVSSNLTTTFNIAWEGGDDQGQLTKTGAGTVILAGASSHGGPIVVAEGVAVLADNMALGSTFAPTIVSNGAALHLSGGRTLAERAIIQGNGVGNTGAIRGSTVNSTWSGGVVLSGDTRIEANGARLDFINMNIEGTNGGHFNLTVGGDGGRVRFNNATTAPYDVPVNLGNGLFIKEGSTLLQLENTNTCGAFYFNGGDIYPRNDAAWAGFGQNRIIYVGPGAGNFRASFQDIYLGYYGGIQLVLAPGANVGFDAAASWTLWVDCTIVGNGGIAKRGTGLAVLTNYHSTFTGNTTVENGTLVLAANSSISNSTVIDVWTNGTFNVSAHVPTFVLQPAQTLKGNGTVQGNVTALGTLAPGGSVGTLSLNGNLTLAGPILIEVDKSLSPSSDRLNVSGALNHSGGASLQVANLGPALAPGDSFQVFNKPVVNGQSISVSGAGASWTNRLAVDGSIAVLAVAPPVVPATNLTIAVSGPASRTLGGQGAANSAYYVYASTNVSLPMSNWWLIGVTNSDAGGLIRFVDAGATNAQRFYRFGQPAP